MTVAELLDLCNTWPGDLRDEIRVCVRGTRDRVHNVVLAEIRPVPTGQINGLLLVLSADEEPKAGRVVYDEKT